MDLLNKILIWLFGIELTLTVCNVYFFNRITFWLYKAIINPNSPTTLGVDSFSLYETSTNLIFSIFAILSLTLFYFGLRLMRSRNIWFENSMNFHFKNRLLISKLVGVIFIARYLLFMVNDFALIGNSSSSQSGLSQFMTSHNLLTNTAFAFDSAGAQFSLAVLFQFFADIVSSLVYAILHFFVIVYIEFTSDKEIITQENLYPENSQ